MELTEDSVANVAERAANTRTANFPLGLAVRLALVSPPWQGLHAGGSWLLWGEV